MVQYGRSSRSSWAKSVRSSSCRTIMGKTSRKSFIGSRLGKSSRLRILIRQPRIIEYSFLFIWTIERSSSGRTIVGTAMWESSVELWLGKSIKLGMLFRQLSKGLFVSVYLDDRKLSGKKQNIDPMWKVLMKDVDLWQPTSFRDHVDLVCIQRECQSSKDIVKNYRNMIESKIFAETTEKPSYSQNLDANNSSLAYDRKVIRSDEQNNSTIIQIRNTMHWLPSTERKRNGICRRIVKRLLTNWSKILYFSRILSSDILWPVQLACVVSYWIRVRDKHWEDLIVYIYRQYTQFCGVGKTAQQCRLGLLRNSEEPKIKYEETRPVVQHQTSTPKTKPRFQPSTTILISVMLLMFRRISSLLNSVPCCTFLKTTRQMLKWSSKAEIQEWDTYPDVTE